jgi:hypothetical protein
MSKQLDDLDKNELRDRAVDMGLAVNPSMAKENLIALIRDKMGLQAPPALAVGHEPEADERVWIEIQKTSEETGSDDVFLGCNFRNYQIKRGVPVFVPRSVVHVLENAIKTLYKWNESTREIIPRHVKSYPFSFVSGPI